MLLYSGMDNEENKGIDPPLNCYISIEPNIQIVKKPTKKQKELLELTHSVIHATGKEPTLTFLAEQLKIKLPSVHDHRILLRKKGYLLGFIYCPYCGVKI